MWGTAAQDFGDPATSVPVRAGNTGERGCPTGRAPDARRGASFGGQPPGRPASLLKRWLLDRLPYASAGDQRSAVFREEEHEDPRLIGGGDPPKAYWSVVLTEALHRVFQANGLDAFPSRVPKPTCIDVGVRLGRRSPVPDNVGSAIMEGSQSSEGCLIATGQ